MGLFLNEDPEELLNSVVLTRDEIQELENADDLSVGDQVAVYCYLNQDNKVVATMKPPIVGLGEVGILECVSSNRYGAFLHWGYDKDILLPFNEQLTEVKKGHKVLVGIYTDKSGRLCATQKMKKFLLSACPFKEGDLVEGVIYDINPEIGAFVAVAHKYYGLILANELMPNMKIGQKVTGRITKVRDDGKMNLTVNKRVDLQMDEDSAIIYQLLEENDGFLPYHDKTDAEDIRRVFNMSKKAFKRSIGQLYRENRITIDDTGIHQV